MSDSVEVQSAEIIVQAHAPQFRASVQITPRGLLAIAALVSSILVSTCGIVWVAGVTRRRTHPFG